MKDLDALTEENPSMYDSFKISSYLKKQKRNFLDDEPNLVQLKFLPTNVRGQHHLGSKQTDVGFSYVPGDRPPLVYRHELAHKYGTINEDNTDAIAHSQAGYAEIPRTIQAAINRGNRQIQYGKAA